MKKVILLTFLSISSIFAQSEPVNSEHPVYSFLRRASVAGYIPYYDGAILPKSKTEIKKNLSELLNVKNSLPVSLSEELSFYEEMFLSQRDNKEFNFEDYTTSAEPVHLFEYSGENYFVTLDPVLNLTAHGVGDDSYSDKTAFYLRYGGYARFNYKNWLSAYIIAWNGNAYGSREVNAVDKIVGQKFTFRKTGLNHFDGSEGGIFIEHDIFSGSISRNRTEWGENFYNKDKISGVSQFFDKISFEIKTELFTYNYLHGWLVTPQFITPGDSISGDYKNRAEKYSAQNRISVNLSKRLNISVWQSVVYANRGVDLAYLNPFLFWESAQRSLEDLDNSFIGLDVRYKPVNGIELTGSMIFDDINFEFLQPGKFQKFNNRFSFMGGLLYIPEFAGRLTAGLTYYFVRPYTFSHPGKSENLAYTNNSFPLGIDIKPNSEMLNLHLDYQFTPRLRLSMDIKHIRHGENIYDNSGNLLQNHGGSFFISTNQFSSEDAWFLAGEFQNTTTVEFLLFYTPGANTLIKAGYVFNKSNFNAPVPENYFYTSLNLLYF